MAKLTKEGTKEFKALRASADRGARDVYEIRATQICRQPDGTRFAEHYPVHLVKADTKKAAQAAARKVLRPRYRGQFCQVSLKVEPYAPGWVIDMDAPGPGPAPKRKPAKKKPAKAAKSGKKQPDWALWGLWGLGASPKRPRSGLCPPCPSAGPSPVRRKR